MIKAFTLIELVFVIVIIGILSTQISPNFNRNGLQEAANQLVSHIRYTQHLAMMDNKFDPKDKFWFRGRWQLQFGKSHSGSKHTNDSYTYSIYSDKIGHSGKRTGNPDISEFAKNPLNPDKYLSGGYSNTLHYEDKKALKSMNMGKSYGIKGVKFIKGCYSANRIAFDNIGRPIRGNISKMKKAYVKQNVVKKQCIIQLCLDRPCSTSNKERFIEIAIEPETGYTHIL